MRLLITGGSGWVGYHLQKLCVDPVILDIKEPQYPTENSVVLHDVSKPLELEEYLEIDGVVHLAALTGIQECDTDPELALATNVIGTRNVLEFCRKRDLPLTFISTLGTYSIPTIYSASKMSGEWLCGEYNTRYGLKTVILRCSNIYGSNYNLKAKQTVVPIFIKNALLDKILYVEGKGVQTRDFIHVEDVCKAILAAQAYPNSAYFEIVTGKKTSILGLAELIIELVEEGTIAYTEMTPWRKHLESALPARMRRENERVLGWKAEINLKEGLRRTIMWAKLQ